jgi:hypothetical protein
MSNALKYIKDLEAAGFQRSQAEAQVQMVLDAIEGDLVTKHDFAVFKEHIDNRFVQTETRLTNQFSQFQYEVENRFSQLNLRFKETELRMTIRLGIVAVSTATVSIAVLTWLIKI